MKDVFIDENLERGIQFKVGLIGEGYRAQATKDGTPIRVNIYDSRFLDYMAERIRQHTEKKYDNRIIIAGPPGTGKTTTGITLARKIDPDFPVENISFRLVDFRKTLASLPYANPEEDIYPVALLDESGVDLYSKDWATVHVKEFVKIFGIVRKKRCTMILALPHRNLLARDLRDYSMHWWFELKTLHDYRGFGEIREAVPNPWRAPWWKPLCGYVFDELDDDFWHEYERRKDEFIDTYIAEEPGAGSFRVQKLTGQRDACIKELRKTHTLREIEKLTGLNNASICRLSNK